MLESVQEIQIKPLSDINKMLNQSAAYSKQK